MTVLCRLWVLGVVGRELSFSLSCNFPFIVNSMVVLILYVKGRDCGGGCSSGNLLPSVMSHIFLLRASEVMGLIVDKEMAEL